MFTAENASTVFAAAIFNFFQKEFNTSFGEKVWVYQLEFVLREDILQASSDIIYNNAN
jgi:hypothetical protein